MAVGLRIKLPGGTAAMYDELHQRMKIDDDPPEGLIFHSGGPIDEGWGVIDFWESRQQFDSFQETRLGPAIGEMDQGPDGPPDIKEFPVHHITKP